MTSPKLMAARSFVSAASAAEEDDRIRDRVREKERQIAARVSQRGLAGGRRGPAPTLTRGVRVCAQLSRASTLGHVFGVGDEGDATPASDLTAGSDAEGDRRGGARGAAPEDDEQ